MTEFMLTEGGNISFELSGPTDGPLLILAPGIGNMRAEYRFLASRLAAAGKRVAVMDLRGHGESSTGWAEYSPQAVGRDLLALAAHLGAQRMILGGCSMAAASAVWAAAEAPDQVAGLVLLGPSLEDGELSAGQKISLQIGLAGPWRVRMWDAYLASLFPVRKPDDLAAYRQQLRANLAEPGRFAAAKALLNASKSACSERMTAVDAPAVLIMGKEDPDYGDPPAIAAKWGKVLRAEVKVIDGAGHYPHVDSPDVSAALIIHWMHDAQIALA